jgi:peroxiredoxin
LIGVSSDDFDSHKRFGEKFELPFALLVDEGGALRKSFGNPDGSEDLYARITYIVDAEGVVRAVAGGPSANVDAQVALVKEWAALLSAESAK